MFVHLLLGKGLCQSLAAVFVQSEHQHAAGALVQAVHGPQMLADLVAQALQHKTFFVARNGAAMYQPARRLVNGDQIVVAVQDGKGLGEVVQSEKTRAWQSLRV